MEKRIRVGLIGFGVGGQIFHAPVLTTVPGLELVGIRASRTEQVAVARSKYPAARVFSTPHEVFEDKGIELIVISTPNTSHHSLAMAALQAGKHVVLDKPFTIDTTEADELIKVANSKGLLLSVYQSRRFDGDFATVKKIIQNGLLGDLAEMESRYDRFRNELRPGAWREEDGPGTGILYDLGSHLIDQALDLFGLPSAITADLRMQRKSAKAVDNFELLLHYPNLKVSLKAGMLVREPLPRFILFGTNGSFVKYGLDPQEETLKAGLTALSKADYGVEPASGWGKLNTLWNGLHFTGTIETARGNYADFYSNVYEAILGKASLLVTAQQARDTIRIIELATRSQEEKRTVLYSHNDIDQ